MNNKRFISIICVLLCLLLTSCAKEENNSSVASNNSVNYYLKCSDAEKTLDIYIGEPYKINYETNDTSITFSSNNERIASVSSDGVITGHVSYLEMAKPIIATITISTPHAGSKEVNVLPIDREYEFEDLLSKKTIVIKDIPFLDNAPAKYIGVKVKYIGEKKVDNYSIFLGAENSAGETETMYNIAHGKYSWTDPELWNSSFMFSFDEPVNKGDTLKLDAGMLSTDIKKINIIFLFHFNDGTTGKCTYSKNT